MFNRNRLALARKRRQLTKKELAELAGITQITLTRLEKNQTTEPTEETVKALAHALKYPVDFFFGDDCEELTTEAVSFRSLSTLTSRQRDAALAVGSLAFLYDDWIKEKFLLPSPDVPDLRDEDPVTAAEALREHWGIGTRPIPSLIKLLEAKGVRIFSLSERNKNVDAYSCWKSDTPYVFLNTFKSAERSRFDTAHELGHLVLHRHGPSSNRDVERDADAFASAFLIHHGDLISHLPRVTSIKQLVQYKARWGVSVAALARTAFNVGLVSDWHYRELCRQISILGYRTHEPNSIPREKSVLWQKILGVLWKDGITREHVGRILHVPPDEIEALMGPLVTQQLEEIEPDRPQLRAVI